VFDLVFRIGGTTWDVDGREEVTYYNPSAYGTDNPTTLDVTDFGGGEIRMGALGIAEGDKTFGGTLGGREFAMSFTQCDVLDFEAAQITIVTGEDTDGDGLDNHLDLDSDNDGIPDNIEAH